MVARPKMQGNKGDGINRTVENIVSLQKGNNMFDGSLPFIPPLLYPSFGPGHDVSK